MIFGEQLDLPIMTPAGSPAAGYIYLYFKADGCLYSKNAAGAESKIDTGNTIVVLASNLALPSQGGHYIALSNGFNPTLPTAVGNTGTYTVKNTGATAITVATTSAQTVDGQAGPITILPGNSYTFVSNNANWFII